MSQVSKLTCKIDVLKSKGCVIGWFTQSLGDLHHNKAQNLGKLYSQHCH